MKLTFTILGLMGLLSACAGSGSTSERAYASPPPRSGEDEGRINCVANGGFLVASGNDFACRLESGQVVSLQNFG